MMNRRPKRGFTLIEMLVAILLLSFISMALYRAFFQISNYSLTLKSSMKAQEELRLLMKIILDDLQAVQYLENFTKSSSSPNSRDSRIKQSGIFSKRTIGPGGREVSFIHFHHAGPAKFYRELEYVQKDPEVHEVSYFLEEDAERGTWVLKRREDFYIDEDMTKGGRVRVLSENIVSFELKFLDRIVRRSSVGRGGSVAPKLELLPEWDSQEGRCSSKPGSSKPCLPIFISLTMSIRDGEAVQEDGEEKQKLMTHTMDLNLPKSIQ